MSKKLKTITDFLILTIVFLLPFQTRYIWRTGTLNDGPWEYGTISLYAIDLLLLTALLLALIVDFFRGQGGFKHKQYWLAIIGLLFFANLSIFACFSFAVAPDKYLVLYGVGRLALGAGLFWLIYSSKLSLKKILITLLLAASLQAVFGLWQFLNQGTPANKWLGLAAHAPTELGAAVVETISPGGASERWLRAYGSLDHPNIFGGYLALALLVAVLMLIKEVSGTGQRKRELLLSFTIIILTAGLFVSFSRAAWLTLAGGLVIILLTNFKLWPRLLLTLAIMALTVAPFAKNYGHLYWQRWAALDDISSVNSRLEVKSIAERTQYIAQAKTLIANHYLVGVGLGNFGLAVAQEVTPKQLSYYYQPVHNVWLLVASEIGVFGLLFLITLLILLIGNGRRLKEFNFVWPLAAGLLILMTFDHWLWSLHFGVLFFWLALGLMLKNIEEIKDNPPLDNLPIM